MTVPSAFHPRKRVHELHDEEHSEEDSEEDSEEESEEDSEDEIPVDEDEDNKL